MVLFFYVENGIKVLNVVIIIFKVIYFIFKEDGLFDIKMKKSKEWL